MKVRLNFFLSVVACAGFAVSGLSASALQATGGTMTPAKPMGTAPSSTSATAKPGATASSAKAMPTDAQIADAKSKGMVWVNLNTKVYHKDDAVYGKTKNGQFMTEADAQKSGARLAKASPIGKKKTQ